MQNRSFYGLFGGHPSKWVIVFPHIAAVCDDIPAIDDPANFPTAIDLMIEAIRARTRNPL